MSTHPPLFTALARRLSPRHPVSVLARRIALMEHVNEITDRQIQRALIYGSAFAGTPPYRRPSANED